jgi:hypothetical protein
VLRQHGADAAALQQQQLDAPTLAQRISAPIRRPNPAPPPW